MNTLTDVFLAVGVILGVLSILLLVVLATAAVYCDIQRARYANRTLYVPEEWTQEEPYYGRLR